MKICNLALVCLGLLMLLSSIQLEILHHTGDAWIWIHIILGIFLSVIIAWHLLLHYKSRWQKLFSKQTKPKIKIMAVLIMLTLVTGLIATVHWLAGYAHNAIGGIHGKLGFLFLIIAVTHCFRYRKFYMNKSKKHA